MESEKQREYVRRQQQLRAMANSTANKVKNNVYVFCICINYLCLIMLLFHSCVSSIYIINITNQVNVCMLGLV